MKKSLRILLALGLLFCGMSISYVPLVLAGAIKASGRDQHIISPVWAKVAFYPAAQIVRFIDLCRFRSCFLGVWNSTDTAYPYKITLTSLAFDTASGTLTQGSTVSSINLRDMTHHLYRQPFGDPVMMIEGRDDCFFHFNKGSLTLGVPTGPWKDRSRPVHTICLKKLSSV